MSFVKAFRLACLLLVLGWGGTAQAGYLLTGNSGGNAQIGTGLPLPAAPIFLGGMTVGDAANFPVLGIPPNSAFSTGGAASSHLTQTGGTAQGGKIVIPTGALSTPAPGTGNTVAVFTTNPAVFQVQTTINYAWPAASLTLSAGGAPGMVVLGTGGGGVITYSGGTKAFGGPGQFAISPGPNAGTFRVPPNPTGMLPVATVWINAFGALPASVMTVAVVGASNNLGLGQQGAPIASPAGTTAFGGLTTLGFGAVNIGPGFTVGPQGTINMSLPVGGPGLSNMVTASKGYPWSTGLITVSQPGAAPPEVFFLKGTDTRSAMGQGNISLVSGALSLRALSGPNANRGWLSLPEPTIALGATGALLMLGLCHGLVRRRQR